jgi:hypothetical protein
VIGLQQVAIAALAIGCFTAGYGVSFLKLDSREPEQAYINIMRQCVFLGERENQCAEEWRSMDTQERFFYSESGRRAQAKFVIEAGSVAIAGYPISDSFKGRSPSRTKRAMNGLGLQ